MQLLRLASELPAAALHEAASEDWPGSAGPLLLPAH